jgi:aspartate/methionine/tyrosine aminotransferase/prephenate dehydrogenase
MKIGIYGYGRFGAFLAESIQHYFDVIVTDFNVNNMEKKLDSIIYFDETNFFKEEFDIVIFANSINSFESVIKKINPEFFKNKLIVDVLSVKEFALDIFEKYLPNDTEIMLTHPMFGPDSAGKDMWKDKKLVYELINIKNFERVDKFLNFWLMRGCNLIRMSPKKHDELSSRSQLITHFVGRVLNELNLKETEIDTDGFKSLLKIINNTCNDSKDLFLGLSNKNKNTKKLISDFKFAISKMESEMFGIEPITFSATSIMLNKVTEMQKNNISVINSAIGVPSWDYNTKFSNAYSTSYGELELRKEIVKYFEHKISVSNVLITNGGKPAIYYTLVALTKPGSNWLLPIPYWVSYPDMIKMVGGDTIYLYSSPNNSWLFKLEDVEEYFKQENVNGIIICNPNNPTGLVYPEDFLDKLLKLAEKYNKKIISDEVYLPLINSKESLFFNSPSTVISIWSFSKGWGLAGWRLGFILSEEKLIKKLSGIQSNINTCPSTSSQKIALELLQNKWYPTEEFERLNIYKNELIQIFKNNGWTIPENQHNSMYIFPVNNKINIKEYQEKLLINGLAVIDGSSFGVPQAIRLTVFSDYDTHKKIKEIISLIPQIDC